MSDNSKAKGPQIEGDWDADDLRRAFVAGAKWWEYRKTGATMWQSDRNLAEQEADKHYPNGRLPEAQNIEPQRNDSLPRSTTNHFPNGMEQKDHILRLARGAFAVGANFGLFVFMLKAYVDDELAIDSGELSSWWHLGSEENLLYAINYLTHKLHEEARLKGKQ